MLQWTAASCLSIYTASSSLPAVPVLMPGESIGEVGKADISDFDSESLGVKSKASGKRGRSGGSSKVPTDNQTDAVCFFLC